MQYFFRISVLFMLFADVATAQQHDFNWVLGRGATGGALLHFDQYRLRISSIQKSAPFYATNTAISDAEGHLVCSFNGIQLLNAAHQPMEGASGLMLGNLPQVYGSSGAPTNQGAMALPVEGQPNWIRLLYWDNQFFQIAPDTPYTAPMHLYMAVIDQQDGGMVLEKNIELATDTFANSGICAVRHANGRDWWVLVPLMTSNRYRTLLLSPNGVDTSFIQQMGKYWPPFSDIGTQCCFSPDGTTYIRFTDEVGLQISAFDRCTGRFFNDRFVPFAFEQGYFCSASISPNSRFAYVGARNRLWQYDLWATDIAASKTFIAEYDGFTNPNACDFYLAQLAPDGKIYLNSWGGCKNLHVIEYPDEPGLACTFRQHDIFINTYTEIGLPNMPNFRLGPLTGGACDTLGIQPLPIAAFRYDTNGLDLRFTNLSAYDPETFHWSFGDGQSSNERNPLHNYPVPGTYEVCLTAGNVFGTDTFCRMITLGTSGFQEPPTSTLFSLWPNPAGSMVQLHFSGNEGAPLHVMICGMDGKIWLDQIAETYNRTLEFSLEQLPPGVFCCKVATPEWTAQLNLLHVLR